MEGEPSGVDLVAIARRLDAWGVRYLVIGGQAVMLHGIPQFSFDIDLWVDPRARDALLDVLEADLGYEVPPSSGAPTPIVTVYAGPERLDLFFVRAMTNREGTTLVLDDAAARAWLHPVAPGLSLPVAAIDDLIALKKMAAAPRAKDEEAIRLLSAKRAGAGRG